MQLIGYSRRVASPKLHVLSTLSALHLPAATHALNSLTVASVARMSNGSTGWAIHLPDAADLLDATGFVDADDLLTAGAREADGRGPAGSAPPDGAETRTADAAIRHATTNERQAGIVLHL